MSTEKSPKTNVAANKFAGNLHGATVNHFAETGFEVYTIKPIEEIHSVKQSISVLKTKNDRGEKLTHISVSLLYLLIAKWVNNVNQKDATHKKR
jgi:hypothetical protein